MNKKKILELIHSKQNYKKISMALINGLSKNPGLMALAYKSTTSSASNLSLFHCLLENNKEDIFFELLKNQSFWPLLFREDSEGQSVLHYLVKSEKDNSTLLANILEIRPGLINRLTRNGDTALHIAVKSGRIWAIKALVKQEKNDVLAINEQGESAFGLAANNRAVLNALVSKDLERLRSLSLVSCDTSSSKKSEIRKTFPRFCPLPAGNTSSIMAELENDRRYTWEEALQLMRGDSFQSQEDESLDDFSRTFLELLKNYNEKSTSIVYLRQLSDFIKKSRILSYADSQLEATIFKNGKSQEILAELLQVLQPVVQEESKKLYEKHFRLVENYLQLILIEGFNQNYVKNTPPSFEALDSNKAKLLEALWSMTEMSSINFENGHIPMDLLNRQILGLQQEYSFEEILNGLYLLFPKLDRRQKLLSHYFNWQLLYYNGAIGNISNEASFQNQLSLFGKRSLYYTQGLDELGLPLSKLFDELVKLHSSPFFRNYRQLIDWSNHPKISQRCSFDALVDSALQKKHGERSAEVELIADELRMLTRDFYRNVSLQEFRHNNWSKADQSDKARTILQCTDNFNKLNNYFVQKILSQTSKNVANVLQLLLQLAQALCNFRGESEADLNHLMLIASVLNSHRILRLNKYFKKLTPADREVYNQLDELVSNQENFKWLRRAASSFDSSLPFIPGILGDITKASEGNSKLISKSEQVGGTILNLYERKCKNQFQADCFRTDIREFLAKYTFYNEDEQSLASYVLYPKNVFLDLSQISFSNVTSILQRFNQDFLDQNLLPKIKIGDKLDLPKLSLPKLLSVFHNWLKSMTHLSEPQYLFLQSTLTSLSESVARAIKINNEVYVKKMGFPYIEEHCYKQRLQSFFLYIERIKTQPANRENADSPRTAIGKLKAQLLFFGSSRAMPGEGESKPAKRVQSLNASESSSSLWKEPRRKSTPPSLECGSVGISLDGGLASLTPIEESIIQMASDTFSL